MQTGVTRQLPVLEMRRHCCNEVYRFRSTDQLQDACVDSFERTTRRGMTAIYKRRMHRRITIDHFSCACLLIHMFVAAMQLDMPYGYSNSSREVIAFNELLSDSLRRIPQTRRRAQTAPTADAKACLIRRERCLVHSPHAGGVESVLVLDQPELLA